MDPSILDRYERIKWDNLLMKKLGDAGHLELAQPAYQRIKLFLDKLLSYKVRSSLPQVGINEIQQQVHRLLEFFQTQVLSYSDAGQRDNKVEQIKNEIASILFSLQKYEVYFNVLPTDVNADAELEKRMSQISEERQKEITEIKYLRDIFSSGSPKIEQALEMARNLNDKKQEVDIALEKVERFVATNERAIRGLLEQNAASFAQKADEHRYSLRWENIWMFKKIKYLRDWVQPSWRLGPIVWLFAGMFFGVIVLAIAGYFIFFDVKVTWENIILRAMALVVPSYFAVLFVNQYQIQKRLYEVYKFKDISLQTMIMLQARFREGTDDRKELLRRSMTVIFSEPTVKEDTKIDRQLFSELMRLIREKA